MDTRPPGAEVMRMQYVCEQCDSDQVEITLGPGGGWTAVRFVCRNCGQRWGQMLGLLGELCWDDDFGDGAGGTPVGAKLR